MDFSDKDVAVDLSEVGELAGVEELAVVEELMGVEIVKDLMLLEEDCCGEGCAEDETVKELGSLVKLSVVEELMCKDDDFFSSVSLKDVNFVVGEKDIREDDTDGIIEEVDWRGDDDSVKVDAADSVDEPLDDLDDSCAEEGVLVLFSAVYCVCCFPVADLDARAVPCSSGAKVPTVDHSGTTIVDTMLTTISVT